MRGCDRGLCVILGDRVAIDRAFEMVEAEGNQAAIPKAPVLVFKQHQLVARESRLAAGVMDQHQAQQTVDLGLVRHQSGE